MKKGIAFIILIFSIAVFSYAIWVYNLATQVRVFNINDESSFGTPGFIHTDSRFNERLVGPIETPSDARKQAGILWSELPRGSFYWRPFGVAFDEKNQVWMVTNNYFLPCSSKPQVSILFRKADGKVLGFKRDMAGAVLH